MYRESILKSLICVSSLQTALMEVQKFILNKQSGYICFSNVHTVVEGYKNSVFRNITNSAQLALPDGMPLVWLGKKRGYPQMTRCSGPDFMKELLCLSLSKGYTHYFYGGSPETLQALSEKLSKDYPELRVVGMYSPPFRSLTREEDEKIVGEINRVSPDFVWVGLGAPKQETWMFEHISRINNSILFGVGAAFDFHAGILKRAPVWMQKAGIEWLFRLSQEPGRLYKRYVLTNTQFVYFLVKEMVLQKLHSANRHIHHS